MREENHLVELAHVHQVAHGTEVVARPSAQRNAYFASNRAAFFVGRPPVRDAVAFGRLIHAF